MRLRPSQVRGAKSAGARCQVASAGAHSASAPPQGRKCDFTSRRCDFTRRICVFEAAHLRPRGGASAAGSGPQMRLDTWGGQDTWWPGPSYVLVYGEGAIAIAMIMTSLRKISLSGDADAP